MEPQIVYVQDLGRMDYQAAWDYQELLLRENVRRKTEARVADSPESNDVATRHYFLFVEHPPVYTLGKNGKPENVLISDEEREQKNIGFYRINRGGDITFHGPGQVVGYPIFDLEKFQADLGRYLRALEEVIIRTLDTYGIAAGRSAGETGVWIDPDLRGSERKICAMGIRCSRWITMHGFAFNVNTDLSYFDHIIPCGIRDKKVTSLAAELGKEVPLEEVKERIRYQMEQVFDVRTVTQDLPQNSFAR